MAKKTKDTKKGYTKLFDMFSDTMLRIKDCTKRLKKVEKIEKAKNKKKDKEDVSEAEVPQMADAIPFRLTKRDVLGDYFHKNVKVKAAVVNDKVMIPYWGKNETPYPFANIVGASLWLGEAAAKGFERGYSKDTYDTHSGELKSALSMQGINFDDMITTHDVIFHQKATITDKTYSSNAYGTPLSDASQNYVNVSKHWVSQQVYDINDEGKVFINPSYRGSILSAPNRKNNREICKLVKLIPGDIANQCNIQSNGKIQCIRFLESVKPIIQNNRVSPDNLTVLKNGGRNEKYGQFTEYFKKFDCVSEDGKIDVDKYIGIIRDDKDFKAEEFVSEFLMKYMLCSDPEHTYVWVKVTDPRAGDCSKDIQIYKALNEGKKTFECTENENIDECVDEEKEVTEAITGLSDEDGNIMGDTWGTTFFNSIVSAKQQASKRVLTFITKGRDKQVQILKEVLNQKLIGTVREFIVIDDVESDVKELDYSVLFKNSNYKSVLDKTAIKKFSCKKISGKCIGFQLDPEIEEARIEEQIKRQKVNNREFLDKYLSEYTSSYDKDFSSFHITLVCPVGMGNDIKSYFFFVGYDQIDNPKFETSSPLPEELLSTVIPSDDNTLKSVLWYNEATSPKTDRINVSYGKQGRLHNAAGTTIGATSNTVKEPII